MSLRLVLLKGKVASGKTTAPHSLRKKKEMEEWIILDFSEIKNQFAYLGDEKRREYGTESLFAILKVFMAKKKNILVDEMSEGSLKKGISSHIKKYKYPITTCEFDARIKTSIKREAKRMKKKGQKPLGEKWIRDSHKIHLARHDPKGILVDCDRLGREQVVNLILRHLK